jgi:hypothetical protein
VSVFAGPWELIALAMADRKIDAIIAAHVDEIDQQLPMLHALYEMQKEGQYYEVLLILDMLEGKWV